MLISVFDSIYFDPSSVRVDDYEPTYSQYPNGWNGDKYGKPVINARVIFGKREQYNEGYDSRSTPEPRYYTAIDCIIIEGKSSHEVAAEINKKIKEIT